MTQRFILDENIVILAQKGEDDKGDPDASSLQLVIRIIRICHTIVLDPNLWQKYLHQLNLPRDYDPRTGFRLLPVLINAQRREGKVEDRTINAAPFAEEGSVPQGSRDDVPIVRLAVETGAMLVTTDRALTDDLNSSGVARRYNLQLLSPEETLQTLLAEP